jgi:integrase
MRAGVEDRWHRPPRRGEQPPWPSDDNGPGCWCTDPKHATPATLVTTARHGTGRRWLARWVDRGGNERSKAFARKVEAQNHIASITAALTTGTYADPKQGANTFAEMADEWIAAKEASLKPSTAGGYRSLLAVTLKPRWGTVKLADIRHADVQQWVTWLTTDPEARKAKTTKKSGKRTPLSAARAIHAHRVLKQVLDYAVRDGRLGANPALGVVLPRVVATEDTALSHEQVKALAEASGEMSTMIYTLAYTALRFGECAALRVGDVDVERKRIKVRHAVAQVAGLGIVEGTPKTHQQRIVPILTSTLANLLADAIKDRDPAEHVFPGPDSGPMRNDWFRWRFDKACASAGLSGISPKTLRHTAGSLALASGASVVTVQKLLGHRNATTTMNVYSHMLPDDFDKLAAAMDAAAKG